MLSLIVLSVVPLVVVIFALQNAQAAGVLIALANRRLRWSRGRPVTGPARAAAHPSEPGHSSPRQD